MGAHFEGALDLFDDETARDPRERLRPERRSAEALIEHLKRDHRARIVGEVVAPERPARFAGFPDALDPRLRTALEARGIRELYSHQREAWAHVTGGHDTVIVTPTASGKTLCYNLPVIDAALKTGAKALYLFPTKALSQDQVSEILELNAAGQLGVRAYTFDGDTPGDARRAVRTHGDIVVSNPDMLHQAILPHHTKWAQFFAALHFVVIDELHTYRGVFGSHVSNLVRRLRRICRFYEADPVFIACSATIANPAELAERLLGGPVRAVTESGAPQGRKHFLRLEPAGAECRSRHPRVRAVAVDADRAAGR